MWRVAKSDGDKNVCNAKKLRKAKLLVANTAKPEFSFPLREFDNLSFFEKWKRHRFNFFAKNIFFHYRLYQYSAKMFGRKTSILLQSVSKRGKKQNADVRNKIHDLHIPKNIEMECLRLISLMSQPITKIKIKMWGIITEIRKTFRLIADYTVSVFAVKLRWAWWRRGGSLALLS